MDENLRVLALASTIKRAKSQEELRRAYKKALENEIAERFVDTTREPELSNAGKMLGGGEPRVWIAEKAIPEEVTALVHDYVTIFETQVIDPVAEERTIIIKTPVKNDLRVGDTIYFQRLGRFGHKTGWDRVVLIDEWPNRHRTHRRRVSA